MEWAWWQEKPKTGGGNWHGDRAICPSHFQFLSLIPFAWLFFLHLASAFLGASYCIYQSTNYPLFESSSYWNQPTKNTMAEVASIPPSSIPRPHSRSSIRSPSQEIPRPSSRSSLIQPPTPTPLQESTNNSRSSAPPSSFSETPSRPPRSKRRSSYDTLVQLSAGESLIPLPLGARPEAIQEGVPLGTPSRAKRDSSIDGYTVDARPLTPTRSLSSECYTNHHSNKADKTVLGIPVSSVGPSL